jgi:hypothetical protein
MLRLAWLDEEVSALTKLSEKGYTLDQVVKSGVFKSRSRDAISAKATSLHLSLAGKTASIDREALERLLDQEVQDA